MMENCPDCGCSRVVPVLFARMLNQPGGGNPYRNYCLECEKFHHAVSKEDFKTHLRPYVLPRDVDQDDPESVIPLEEWNEKERYEAVVERVERYKAETDEERPCRTAPGDANRFDCPACGRSNWGYPESCPGCGERYSW